MLKGNMPNPRASERGFVKSLLCNERDQEYSAWFKDPRRLYELIFQEIDDQRGLPLTISES